MILSEYNEELHIKSEKKISFEEGAAQGQERVNLLIARLAEAGRTEDLIRSATDPNIRSSCSGNLGFSPSATGKRPWAHYIQIKNAAALIDMSCGSTSNRILIFL